jgi:hypothetical protein
MWFTEKALKPDVLLHLPIWTTHAVPGVPHGASVARLRSQSPEGKVTPCDTSLAIHMTEAPLLTWTLPVWLLVASLTITNAGAEDALPKYQTCLPAGADVVGTAEATLAAGRLSPKRSANVIKEINRNLLKSRLPPSYSAKQPASNQRSGSLSRSSS